MEPPPFNTYGDAIKAALEWLRARGITNLDEAFEASLAASECGPLLARQDTALNGTNAPDLASTCGTTRSRGPISSFEGMNRMSGQNGGSSTGETHGSSDAAATIDISDGEISAETGRLTRRCSRRPSAAADRQH
jgi:hypothetical protein